MKKILSISLVLTLSSTMIACSSLKFPGVYRLRVLQGNYIEQEMVDQLEKGMTRDQVRFVMGTPLIEDTFSPDRWDYFFNVRRGDDTLREFHFSVFFDEQDLLARWEGDYEPTKETDEENEAEALEQADKKEAAKFK